MRTLLLLAAVLGVSGCERAGAAGPALAPPVAAPVALAVVFSGNEVWCGNTEHETNPVARYPGALNQVRDAFAHGLPAKTFPAGSRAALLTYDIEPHVRIPMGPAGALDARAFGVERDYRGVIGTELGKGLDRAIAMLEAEPAEKRVLVVIGDGNDLDNEAGKRHFRELTQRLARAHIAAYAIIVPSELSPEGQIMTTLTSHVVTVTTPAEIPSRVAEIWAQL